MKVLCMCAYVIVFSNLGPTGASFGLKYVYMVLNLS